MLSGGEKRPNLAGKLLLSFGLVAASLAYGWWQRAGMVARTPALPLTNRLSPASAPAMTARTLPAPPVATPDAAAGSPVAPGSTIAPLTPKAAVATPAPRAQMPAAQSQPTLLAPPPDAPVTALAELRMYLPPPPQPPLPLVTGTPAPGAAAPIPAGTHLQDGDYLSDRLQYAWGDLQVKIFIHGGQITGAQVVQYPDHRAESLELSQMSTPILNSELIRTQQAKVDVVSSATDTSYVYQDAIASAIMKATRQ